MASNPQSLMGPPPIPPKIARWKTNDNPLMTRRPPRRPIESRAPKANSTTTSNAPTAIPTPEEELNPEEWISYKLVTTKKALLAGQRYHVMRLHPKQYDQVPDPTDRFGSRTVAVPRKVDVTNPEEFKRPIRLHRRDPTAPLGGVMETDAAKLVPKEVEVDTEKEEQNAFRAERARIKAEQLAKIAPDGGAREKKKMAFMKKTQQVHRVADAANKRIRYEEEFPWFIEDYDNTNTWKGQREHAMSNGTFMLLDFDATFSTFNMIPVEKWYKFTEIKKHHKLTKEEIAVAEKKRKAAGALPSWLKSGIKKQEFVETEELTAVEQEAYNKNSRIATTKKIFTAKGQSNKNNAGDEELDYNEDRFDDDDAGAVVCFGDGDEDEEALKATEARVKKEQLSANAFDIRTEFDYEDDIKEKNKLEGLAKEHGKKVTKALKKREGNYTYDSDSEKNPYASSDESEDEDELYRRFELKKKEEEAKKEAERVAKETAIEEAAKQLEKKEAAKKQKGQVRKQKNTKESSTFPAVGAAPPIFITHAISKFAGRGKGSANETIPLAEGIAPKKRARSPTLSESSNDAKRRRQNKDSSSILKTSNTLKVPEGKLWDNGRSPGPSKNPNIPGKRVWDNKRIPSDPSGDKTGVPIEGNNKSKRKSSSEVGENDQTRKSKKQKHAASIGSALAPPSLSNQPIISTPTLGITDEEIIALLRAHPEGISIKSMANTFKSRLRVGTNDVAILAGRLKQFGKGDADKVFRLKEECF